MTQSPGPDLPYGTVPAPRAQMVGLFLVFTCTLAGRCCDNPQSSNGPAQRIRPGNKMIGWHNHLLHHFSTTIHLHLASSYAKKYFLKKRYLGNCSLSKLSNLN